MQRNLRLLTLIALALAVAAPPAAARSIAYNFNAGQAGNQGFGGELGNDFTVNVPIRVTEVGVFDAEVARLPRLVARVRELEKRLAALEAKYGKDA